METPQGHVYEDGTFQAEPHEPVEATEEKVAKRGRPETYPDASLIVFYTIYDAQGDHGYARTAQ